MNVLKVTNDAQLKDAYAIRMKVFVDEQHVPEEEELDDLEKVATHFVMYQEDQVVGAGRLRVVDQVAKVERICIAKEIRGTGAGRLLMSKIENEARSLGLSKARLNAQTHAAPFYSKLGYETISGEFLDAGIPHVTMTKTL
ncbi:GNAT family N-acetyltransferase [Alkalihalophilus lindianensis]|uniref:GNAT family N-acetyltransferase n=1 Tax=Alkalihalophilus lindianensis TaxID=1630542 RepID=A0ABU3X5X9_9BACI|nr:GNAT family N-acetyltransferase [Alkalihalophilus lindianensis]MDV2683203.1 GNAT family N-acetyltransferase [Alkalihalophilus lindianensis]